MKTQLLFLLGFGGVGRALLKQILEARALHAKRNHLILKIVGIADSSGVVLDDDGFSDDRLRSLLDQKNKTGKLGSERAQFADDLPEDVIVVDTTATDKTVPLLLDAKQKGMGVVLANKLPLAGKLEWWDALSDARSRWETTCGAALPVVSTLNTLLDSGDEVRKIEGTLSGTLGFIASQLEAGAKFGDAVREAKAKGYTEPDPRQDLGGLDVARKALILARMLGYRLEMSDVKVESLYPKALDALSVDEFMREVDSLNDRMRRRIDELTRGGKKLRYAAVIEDGMLGAGWVGADMSSKLGSVRTSDSAVIFHTKFFDDNPLAVSGRGAGQAVTASGVLGDIVSLAK